MSDNEIMKVPETVLDGFDSNADESQNRRVIQGVRVTFTNDFEWVDNNDETISRDRESHHGRPHARATEVDRPDAG